MKNIFQFFLIGIFFVCSFSSFAQNNKLVEAKIKTSAECDMCGKTIGKALLLEKGIKSAKLDTAAKMVTVVYKSGKTDLLKIKTAISKAGYDADDVKADPVAQSKLSACCRKHLN